MAARAPAAGYSYRSGNFNSGNNRDGIGCGGISSCPASGTNCFGTTLSCPAELSSPFSIAFHFASNSLFVYSNGLIRRIE